MSDESETPTAPFMSAAMAKAIVDNDLVTLQSLVRSGEAPSAVSERSGYSALMLCAEHDRPTLMKFLLDAGADPNYSLADGWTALHHAVDSEWDWESNGVSKADGHLVRVLVAGGAESRRV